MNQLTHSHTQSESMYAYAGQLITQMKASDSLLADAGTNSLSAAHLIDMLDHVNDGIFFSETNGTLIFANQTLATITGYEKGNLVGSTFAKWLRKDISADILRTIWTAMYESKPWEGHISGATQFGEALELTLKLTPVVENSVTIGYIGILTDITKLKEVEQLKAQFIANVSHELRTPLTNLKTYITLLERGDSKKSGKYVQTIKNETVRLGNLIEDIMSLSRLDEKADKLDLRQVDLVDLLDNVTHIYRLEAAQDAITIRLKRPENKIPTFIGNGEKLHTAISNMLKNAVNFTDHGGDIQVTLSQTKENCRNYALITISDSGVGIGSEEQTHIFKQFYRGAAAADGKIPGTGLGLTMANQIIKSHGGSIEVSSQLGRGTTFTIKLPIGSLVC